VSRVCSNCGGAGPFGRSRYNKDGLKSQCKACCAAKQRAYAAVHPEVWSDWAEANADRLKEREAERYWTDPVGQKAKVRAWQLRNPDKFKANYTRSNLAKYGITPEDRDALFDKQDGKCAICNDPLTTGRTGMQVDHDHKTGVVRSLLCGPCNVMLGDFRENPLLFEVAIGYLERGPVLGLTPMQRPAEAGKPGTRASNLWYKYGLTETTLQELRNRQNGLCAICSIPLSPGQGTHIDHNHKHPRTVRGLLCRSCNIGLGHARENVDVLRRATDYLRRHRLAA